MLSLTPDVAFHDPHDILGRSVLTHPTVRVPQQHRPFPLAYRRLGVAGTSGALQGSWPPCGSVWLPSGQAGPHPRVLQSHAGEKTGEPCGQFAVPPRKWHRPLLVTTHWPTPVTSNAQLQGAGAADAHVPGEELREKGSGCK